MLIVGLGNPGTKYAQTRHNVGFAVVDEVARRISASWSDGHTCSQARGRMRATSVTLLKPQTYMNRSGGPVAERARFYRAMGDDLIVVHDELDIPFGTIRLKKGGGTAGHNGLESIREHLGRADFLRVRVGIDKPEHAGMTSSYVLAPFSDEEQAQLSAVVSGAAEAVERLAFEGLRSAQNEVHGRSFLAN
jgi:peptidyl-tRNA hydrolase, PTH1 family